MSNEPPGTCDELTAAVDIVEKHIRGLDLDRIPENIRGQIMRFLRVSEEISEEFKSDPFLRNLTSSRLSIQHVNIDETKNEWIRIGLAQIDFKLTHSFPYVLIEDSREHIKKKIFAALEVAWKENVDIICFPELSFSEEWIEEIVKYFNKGVIICGSYYDKDNRNLCQIIIDGNIYSYAKCHPSIMEEKNGSGMEPGNCLFTFQTKYGKISILNCVDFDYEINNILDFDLNIVINLRLDIDKEHDFQKKSNLVIDRPDGSRNPMFIIHVNSKIAEWGASKGGGGTSVIGLENPLRLEKYKKDGLRPNDGMKYKVCEAKEEMLLIAEINIKENSERRTKMGNWYVYKEDKWCMTDNKNIWIYE